MKALFLLIVVGTTLPACMTEQDKLNWEQTVSWYKGQETSSPIAQEPAAPAPLEDKQTVEAKVGQEKDETESPAAAEAK